MEERSPEALGEDRIRVLGQSPEERHFYPWVRESERDQIQEDRVDVQGRSLGLDHVQKERRGQDGLGLEGIHGLVGQHILEDW